MSGSSPAPDPVDDLRDLTPPEPLERVLLRTAALKPGESYSAKLPRYPRMLVPHLEQRGLIWSIDESPEGWALLQVRKPG